MKPRHYLQAFLIPVSVLLGIGLGGWWSYTTVLLGFVVVPIAELLMDENKLNPTPDQASAMKEDRRYDALLFLMVPIQYALLALLIWRVHQGVTVAELVGMVVSMGIQSGAVAINVAHELGHRKGKWSQLAAKALLLSALYLHFIVEHNRGHHRWVCTPKDPATARLNESIYAFWLRSIVYSYLSAWRIEAAQLNTKGQLPNGLHNEVLLGTLLQFFAVVALGLVLGWKEAAVFVVTALFGILLLEAVNYIEHYGLMRREVSPGKYERVQAWHSWNSDYPIGRILLFELTRHSDHHFMASKKYQLLNSLDGSPQLPTGYPGSIILTLIPPLWFKTVHPKIPARVRELHSSN